MLLRCRIPMLRPAASEDFDPERTREDVGAATLTLDAERLGRGSILAGKYRLEMLLGEGGMACVWSAYHLELELPVAIKLLKAGPKNEKLAKRLRLEARAAARLAHPSIVRVFDVAVADNGDPFIVMELLSGESLAQVLARERLSSVRAVQLLLPIAEALAVAHAHGIVHRDLKPGNVFLSKEGQELQPKLLDFGIAKMEYASLVKLTDKGTILGSPNYMSPEQVRGDDVDYRSDIWSFCVVLYKALTGVLPFRGSSAHAIMHDILHCDPAPAPVGSPIDEGLAALILCGLSKCPEQRPSCMREFGRQLAQWLLTQGVSDDACGALLTTRWLAHTDPSAQGAAVQAIELEKPPSAQRSARSPRRHWILLAAAAISLVIVTLAWADSAPAPVPRTATGAPASSNGGTTPLLLVAAQSPPPSPAEPSLLAITAIPSTISAPSQPITKPKPNTPARIRAGRAPQLPF